jgi:uncharacterized delta-60 repeat protein
MKVLPDGKFIAVGLTRLLSNSTFNIAMVKYNADGSLDTTFGTNGRVFRTAATTVSAWAIKVAIQADGKIIIVGADLPPVRYNPNGTHDIDFNTPPWAYTTALTIQPDGKILFTGELSLIGSAVVRCNPNGTPDITFGFANNGIVGSNFLPRDNACA